MSTHGILERSGYFGEAFTDRAKQIFNKYYPIEVDPNIEASRNSQEICLNLTIVVHTPG